METRKLVLLMIFSFSLLMLWDNYQAAQGKPTIMGFETPRAKPAADPATSGAGAGSVADLPAPASQIVDSSGPTASGDLPAVQAATVAQAEVLTFSNDVLELQFSTQGAQIVGSRLLNHKSSINPELPVQLFEQSASRTYLGQTGIVGVKGAPNHRSDYRWVQGPTQLADGQDELKIQFVSEQSGIQNLLTYTIKRGEYAIGLDMKVTNQSDQPVSPSAYLQITRDDRPLESDSKLYMTFTGPAIYTPEKKYQKVSFEDISDNSADFVKKSDSGWFALIQHYFVSAVIPQEGPRDNFARRIDAGLYSVGSVASLGVLQPGQAVDYTATWFTGPQDQQTLEALSPGLDLVVDYGWLTMVAQPIFWLLGKIHSIVGNWGWSIILLTVLIKGIFFPLSAASYKSMAKMRKVGPRMQKLKEQYGDDKMGFQRAMMEMYKREKINPLGGCMPILVQIPVFIALYWVLLASVEMRNAPWLGWISDLATPDPYYILPVVMAVTMFIQTKLNPTPPDPIQAKVMMVMPLVFSVMFIFFPSGLVLYWVVNNILSIAQQWVITRRIESGTA